MAETPELLTMIDRLAVLNYELGRIDALEQTKDALLAERDRLDDLIREAVAAFTEAAR